MLGRPIRSYTYISSEDRLVRLTNHDNLVDADWDRLCEELKEPGKDEPGDLEDCFRAEWYLISPLTQPERFLQKEYFLTAQQKDIERQILKKVRAERSGYYSFSGLPGTGKDAASLRYRDETFRASEGLHDPLRDIGRGVEEAS